MSTNFRARFAANNFIGSAPTYTSTACNAANPVINLWNQSRSRTTVFSGNFTLTASNNVIYVNDGSNLSATVPIGQYGYATLAAAIATALNSVSSGWTCTYSYGAGSYRFTIAKASGTATLRLSQTANAVWDAIGYVGSTDRTGSLTYVADQQRNHTDEWVRFDFGLAQSTLFFACIGRIDAAMPFSASASIHVQMNNVDVWTAPPVDVILTPNNLGLFSFFDSLGGAAYRYVRFWFQDRLNPAGPQGFELGHLYVGDYVTTTTTNVGMGYQKVRVDPSLVLETNSGARYFQKKATYRTFQSVTVQQILAAERRALESLYNNVGITQSFYVSLDPTLFISTDLTENTAYVNFLQDPTFTHIYQDYFSMSLALREAT